MTDYYEERKKELNAQVNAELSRARNTKEAEKENGSKPKEKTKKKAKKELSAKEQSKINIKTYFYGIKAKIAELLGMGLIGIGCALGIIYNKLWLIIAIIGLGLHLYGKAMTYDYKKQTGIIVYKGKKK